MMTVIKSFAQVTLMVLLVAFTRSDHGKSPNFRVEIPVELQRNLMFTTVEIKGNPYRFLIDTGAPMALSKNLATEIQFKANRRKTTRSSNLLQGQTLWGTLPEIKIGSLTFSNIPTAVVDFSKTSVLRCMGFDGILGANLMSSSIWQFQYDNRKIIITNSIDSLLYVTEAAKVPIKKVGANKSPYLATSLNQQKPTSVLFDTGYTGFFDLPLSSYYRSVSAPDIDAYIEVINGRGLTAEGVFGSMDTTMYHVKVNQLRIGKEVFSNPVFSMGHTKRPKVGVSFLRSRVVTIDFPSNAMLISNTASGYYPQYFESFGFGVTLYKGQMVVGNLYDNSPAAEAGIMAKDIVMRIDDLEIAEFPQCEALNRSYQIMQKALTLEVVTKREEAVQTVQLSKKILLGSR